MAIVSPIFQSSNAQVLKPAAYSNILISAICSKNSGEIETAFTSLERLGNPSNFTVNDLGRTLVWVIQNKAENFSRRILSLQPYIGFISASGAYGLGHALIEAIKRQDDESFCGIEMQGAYRQISIVDGEYGLNYALLASLRLIIHNPNPKCPPHSLFLRVLLVHPNIGQLNRSRDLDHLDSITQHPFRKALAKAEQEGYRDIVMMIKAFPAAHNQ